MHPWKNEDRGRLSFERTKLASVCDQRGQVFGKPLIDCNKMKASG
jgi:hypothetical protein